MRSGCSTTDVTKAVDNPSFRLVMTPWRASIALAIVFAFGILVAPPQGAMAGQVCDFEHRCYPDQPPQQPYHMDLSHPDREEE